MRILGIETSCDDTGIAIYDHDNGILINKICSQSELHNNYGGVMPELAARSHVNNIAKLMNQVLIESKCHLSSIHAIAYTAGPGLIGSLLVGATFSSSLAFSLNIPTIPINHLEGHLLSPMLHNSSLMFPFLGLLVSGGNTQLVHAKKFGLYDIVGSTVDISVGNAFDKIAKALGLPYPGGPEISKLAIKGNRNRFYFPRPMLKTPGLNFSFSGLRTYVENIINTHSKDIQTKADIAAAFQESITDTLVEKCTRALKQTKVHNLVIAGGVSANNRIKYKLKKLMFQLNGNLFYPNVDLCTDNAAMIAYSGFLRFKLLQYHSNLQIVVYPKWCINEINIANI
ncbi:MAG: tRNA (adenosine(37)-N6)-threonylcarbamoyltransferase complex transferase subunit TsaD [Buchnera aphidicola (Eriosoma harunire)]